MASWSTFLDAVVTRVATVTGVNYSERAAVVDPERLLKIPGRFPAAFVHDLGGEIDVYNGVMNQRFFGITIVSFWPSGVTGGRAEKQLAELSESIVTEFTHTREDSSIRLLSESMEMAEPASQAGEFYMRTLTFFVEL